MCEREREGGIERGREREEGERKEREGEREQDREREGERERRREVMRGFGCKNSSETFLINVEAPV